MKYKHTLLPLLFYLCSLPLMAQKHLQVGHFFGSNYGKQKEATEILMKGKRLKPYNLMLFRSLTLPTQSINIAEIEKAVTADGSKAIDKETGRKGKRLYYGFFQLQPLKGLNCYLFYRNNSLNPANSRKANITLIYMEGKASLDELKKSFAR